MKRTALIVDHPVAEYTSSRQTDIQADGSIVATVDGSGNVTYLGQSMLRTTKMTVSGSGVASGVATYYPYGAQNASIAAEYKFTNQMRDPNGIDHFWMRSYAPDLGRWLTLAPAGLAAVDPANPQSWNRYAYVMNNPTTWTDPNGLVCDASDGTTYDPPPAGPNPLQCTQLGGTWINPVQTGVNVSSDGSSTIVTTGGDAGPGSSSSAGGGGGGNQTSVVAEIRQFFRQAVCGVLSGLTDAASASNSTIGIGAGGNAGAGFILGIAVSGGVQVVADSSGNLGVAFTVGGNPGYGVFGIGAMGGVQGSVSTANTIYGLRGGSFDAGVSFRAGPAVTLDGSAAMDGSAYTGTVTVGTGVGTKATALGIDYTWVPSMLSTNCH